MKKIVFCFLGLLAVLYTASAQSYTFNHGPYLQELSEHAVTFVFTTSDKGFSWVEVKPDGGEAERHYTVRNGLRDAYNTFNVIRVENLRPYTRYQYRLCSKQIADFQPYKVTFGDSIVSPWRRFSTPDPKATACSFAPFTTVGYKPPRVIASLHAFKQIKVSSSGSAKVSFPHSISDSCFVGQLSRSG